MRRRSWRPCQEPLNIFLAIIGGFGNLHGHDDDRVLVVFGTADAAGALGAGQDHVHAGRTEMAQHVHEVAGGEGDAADVAAVGHFQALVGRTGVLPLGGEAHFVVAQVEIGAAVAVGIEDLDAAQGLDGFLAVDGEQAHAVAFQTAHEHRVVGIVMTGTRHGQALGTVQGTQVQALVGDVELDLVHAQPLLHVLQVLLLDEHALFGQTGGQIVMGEGDQGELVAVEAANV